MQKKSHSHGMISTYNRKDRSSYRMPALHHHDILETLLWSYVECKWRQLEVLFSMVSLLDTEPSVSPSSNMNTPLAHSGLWGTSEYLERTVYSVLDIAAP